MKRLLFSILILILLLWIAYHVLMTWRGITLYQVDFSKRNLLRAIQVTPSYSDPYYRLGLFYQWEIQEIDAKESLKYLLMAIERNPLEQEYWLNLAKIYKSLGERSASEKALKNAILLFPTGYQGRWVSGNLFLQEGAIEKALPHFSYILIHYSNQSPLVYDVLVRAINDPEYLLDQIVPKDPFSFRQFLFYLYERGDKEWVQKAWEKKESFGFKADRKTTLQYVDFLIAQREINKAFQVWKEKLHEEGGALPADHNLITNGGFEKEEILGGGFDWKIEKVSGAEISFDLSTAFEGKRSLRIVFNGKENVNFHHVYQFVPLKPNTEYLLKAHMKTKAITTKSGLKMEVVGIGSPFYKASESLVGDHLWEELEIHFQTPPQLKGGIVRVRREKTDKFDRFIGGTVWIDQVRLLEKLK
ncbi:MAG: hypothetical protein HXY44_17500 [Syntrophaceae bacterium]|nr:hypothetical protein [Syntrophaceae bacterium]